MDKKLNVCALYTLSFVCLYLCVETRLILANTDDVIDLKIRIEV